MPNHSITIVILIILLFITFNIIIAFMNYKNTKDKDMYTQDELEEWDQWCDEYNKKHNKKFKIKK